MSCNDKKNAPPSLARSLRSGGTKNSNFLQDLLRSRTCILVVEDIPPHGLRDALVLGQHAPVRRRLGLQPLEVVDLVPLIGDLLFLFG